MTPTNNHATAADFVEYVADARAEGLTDAEIVERWMRQARPGLTLRVNADAVAIYCDRCEIEWGLLSSAVEAGNYHVTITSGYKMLTTGTFHSLSSALAWLANQLAERCPVEVWTPADLLRLAFGDASPHGSLVLAQEAALRSLSFDDLVAPGQIAGQLAEAARLRRMYGLVMPTQN